MFLAINKQIRASRPAVIPHKTQLHSAMYIFHLYKVAAKTGNTDSAMQKNTFYILYPLFGACEFQ
jgi:hypothetical protein